MRGAWVSCGSCSEATGWLFGGGFCKNGTVHPPTVCVHSQILEEKLDKISYTMKGIIGAQGK